MGQGPYISNYTKYLNSLNYIFNNRSKTNSCGFQTNSGRIPEFQSIPVDSVRFCQNFQILVDSAGIPGEIISIVGHGPCMTHAGFCNHCPHSSLGPLCEYKNSLDHCIRKMHFIPGISWDILGWLKML